MPELFCQNGQHTWQRESRRGKRPLNCPEHQEKKSPEKAPQEKKTSNEVWCQKGQHFYHRPPTRGRVPANCPEHKDAQAPKIKAKTLIKESPKAPKLSEEHKQKLIEGRERKALERQEQERQMREQEASTIDERISEAEGRYVSALEKAIKVNDITKIEHAFNLADREQNQLMNLLARKRHLRAVLH